MWLEFVNDDNVSSLTLKVNKIRQWQDGEKTRKRNTRGQNVTRGWACCILTSGHDVRKGHELFLMAS